MPPAAGLALLLMEYVIFSKVTVTVTLPAGMVNLLLFTVREGLVVMPVVLYPVAGFAVTVITSPMFAVVLLRLTVPPAAGLATFDTV